MHGWTSVLEKQMIELELNLSKLTDFIMHAIESIPPLPLPLPHTPLTLVGKVISELLLYLVITLHYT